MSGAKPGATFRRRFRPAERVDEKARFAKLWNALEQTVGKQADVGTDTAYEVEQQQSVEGAMRMVCRNDDRTLGRNCCEIGCGDIRSDLELAQKMRLEWFARPVLADLDAAVDLAQRRNAKRRLDRPPHGGRQLVDAQWVGRHVSARVFDATARYTVAPDRANSLRSSVESAWRARCSRTLTAVGVRLSARADSSVESSSMSRRSKICR